MKEVKNNYYKRRERDKKLNDMIFHFSFKLLYFQTIFSLIFELEMLRTKNILKVIP
jgi:hypothetical protein